MEQTLEKPLVMEQGWYEKLKEEFNKPYMKTLQEFLANEYAQNQIVYPAKDSIFNAFCHTSFEDVKVVIMGQDPYHNPGQAHGLSFSVLEGIKPPPSLMNIYKELKADVGMDIPSHGCLVSWAKQGVLLLNATLTVRKNEPKSHYGMGWETFTDAVIQSLTLKKDPVIFVLWGKSAREKCAHIVSEKSIVLEAPHPSPYSVSSGFFGCKHFSKINALLKERGKKEIDWSI